MALKSRLELEVDGRTAEQQVNSVRIALDALTQAGLRSAPALASVFSSVNGSVRAIAAATASLNAAQAALNALGTSGSRASSGLAGASGSLSTTSANAAAAEARLAAATRAMNELQQSSLRTTSALNGVGGSVTVNTRNASGAVGGLNGNMKSLRSTALELAGPLLGLFGGAQLTGSIYQASEAYSALINRLKLVTSSAEELALAQQAVFGVAQASRQPLTSTAELYQRIATNQKELNLTGKGVAEVVGTISKTLAISGASAASANAALIQLGQAFASGTLRGEELNSVMEQAPALAQAIAAGMGKSVGELRTLGAAGLLTADAVVQALQKQQQAVEDLFNKTNTTIGQSITATGNSFTQFVGRLDQASGTSAKISAELLSLSKYIDGLTASSDQMDRTLNTVSNTLTVMGSGALTYFTARMALAAKATADSIYQYYSARTAAIAAAQATLNQANADVVRARTATALAQAEAALYRGTVLQTVALGRYAEARLAQRAAEAAAASSSAALSAAQGGLLGVMGGPVGLALTVATVAAGYLLFKSNTDQATQSLIDQNLTIDQTIEKFRGLSAEQQRFQKVSWAQQQKDSAEQAAKALEKYRFIGSEAFLQVGNSANGYRQTFNDMVKEVQDGKRSLDSLTEWAKENAGLSDEQISRLAEQASAYSTNTALVKALGDRLNEASNATSSLTASNNTLASSQSSTGGQTRAQVAEWEKYIAKLTETRDLLGANEAAEARYRAAKMGLTAEQTKQAEVVARQIDTLEKYKDAIKENDKVQQAALKAQLVALYTQQQAAEDAAAAVKKSHDDAAKAAEDSATRQITAIEKVAKASYAALLVTSANQQNLSGYGLLTNGGTPPVAPPVSRKTPQQLADERLAQISDTTSPNKGSLRSKAISEDAGQKLLDDARKRYAVLQQQSREIELQGSSARTLGTEAKKLIELETEIADLKEKKTLTTSQKQVLAMAELNLAQQKQNAALERANELTKERFENEQKLKAYQDNLNSQAGLEKDRYRTELEGAGLGDRAKQRAQEALKIQQDYQNRVNKLTNDYTDSNDKSDSRRQLYESELAAESKALADSLERQKQHYADLDALRGNWLLGVSESWQNYVDIATDYNSQARAATESILSDTTSSISTSIQEMIKGTQSLGDAFGNLAGTMANSILGALSDIAAKWIVVQALKLAGIETEKNLTIVAEGEKAAAKVAADGIAEASSLSTIATTLAANVAAAVETLASWAPAALVASIGSFGAAAVVGGTALVAAYALIKGISGGFSSGGYTGPGGVHEPAGIVHKGEVVWSQADVKRFGGVAAVEGLRTGNVSPTTSAQSGGRMEGKSSISSTSTAAPSAPITPIYQTLHINGDVSPETVNMIQQMGVNVAQALRKDIDRNGPIMQSIRRKI